jgi:hypothetical protein
VFTTRSRPAAGLAIVEPAFGSVYRGAVSPSSRVGGSFSVSGAV